MLICLILKYTFTHFKISLETLKHLKLTARRICLFFNYENGKKSFKIVLEMPNLKHKQNILCILNRFMGFRVVR